MSADTPANPHSGRRVHVFVDFWNYELSMRDCDSGFKTDWKKIAGALVNEAINAVQPGAQGEYEGMNVYSSYDPRGDRDKGFRKWMTTVLDIFPGINVSLVERQKKATGPKCPACLAVVGACQKCGADMRGTEEKGVDTRIATDMVSLAWQESYDIAVLVSSDRDFVPVAEFLQAKGIKVIHGAFRPRGSVLTQKCWGSIDIPAIREQFRRA